jgi:hypothetical protein
MPIGQVDVYSGRTVDVRGAGAMSRVLIKVG